MRSFIAGAALILTASVAQAGMTLSSPAFKNGGTLAKAQVYNSFGCDGGNISPALTWSGVPKDAKSLALTMFDPDAPTGSGFWHWTVVNIPVAATGLPEGAGSSDGKLPAGAGHGRVDFGVAGYTGPCPPPGKPHRYVFELWALKKDKLDVGPNTSGAVVGFMVRANSIGKATLTGRYGQPK